MLDYITAGAFLISAAVFWRRNKRAAIAALVSGAADLAVSLLTDYPGGVVKAINFKTHRDIDLGLAAMTATMPEFLAFKDEDERKFFTAQAAMITVATELTKFPERAVRAEKRRHAA
jgi:hypothetical protein